MTNTTFLEIPYLIANLNSPEVVVNDALNIIDAAIAGQLIVPMTADTTYVLKNTNTDNSLTYPYEWQYGILILNVTNTGTTALYLPDGLKMKYIVRNNTGQTINFKTVSGTNIVSILTSTIIQVYSDGTDIWSIS